MNLIWTKQAADQLAAQAARIEIDHPRAAVQWVRRILARLTSSHGFR